MTHKLVQTSFGRLRRRERFFLTDHQSAGVLVKTSRDMAESEVNGVEWSLAQEMSVHQLVPLKENEAQMDLLVVKSGRFS